MASVTSPVQSPIRATSRFSSLYLSPSRISPTVVSLKSRSLGSRASTLSFSPLSENLKPTKPVGVSGEVLWSSGWKQQLRRRASHGFPIVAAAAADADGHEIEIDGLDFLSLSFCLFSFEKNYVIA